MQSVYFSLACKYPPKCFIIQLLVQEPFQQFPHKTRKVFLPIYVHSTGLKPTSTFRTPPESLYVYDQHLVVGEHNHVHINIHVRQPSTFFSFLSRSATTEFSLHFRQSCPISLKVIIIWPMDRCFCMTMTMTKIEEWLQAIREKVSSIRTIYTQTYEENRIHILSFRLIHIQELNTTRLESIRIDMTQLYCLSIANVTKGRRKLNLWPDRN